MKTRILLALALVTFAVSVVFAFARSGVSAERRHLKKKTTATRFSRELVDGKVLDREVVTVNGKVIAAQSIEPQPGCFALNTPEPGTYVASNSLDRVTWHAVGTFHAPDQFAVQCYEPPISPVPFYLELIRTGD
jgi:hypothetical protein